MAKFIVIFVVGLLSILISKAQDNSRMILTGSRESLISKFSSEDVVQLANPDVLILKEYLKGVPTGVYLISIKRAHNEWLSLAPAFRQTNLDVEILSKKVVKVVLKYYPKPYTIIFLKGQVYREYSTT